MNFSTWKKKDQRIYANFHQINSSHKVIKKNYKKLLKLLTNILNNYHNLKQDVSFWETIIGPWLLSFIQVANIEYSKKKKIKKTTIIIEPILSYREFNSMTMNEVFRFNLFKAMNSNYNNYKIIKKNHSKYNFNFYSLCSLGFYWLGSFFIKKIKISMIIANVSNKIDYKIKFLLKIAAIRRNFFNEKERIKIKFMINKKKNNNEFYDFLLNTIHWYIPSNYLENFKNINRYFYKKKFFSNTFFTTHSHITDDIFKIFSANWKKSNKNNIMNIVQHGGGYQTSKINLQAVLESRLGHNFLGWGTYNKFYAKKYIPFFINKENKYWNLDNSSKKNKILIIAKDLMRFDSSQYFHPNISINIYIELINWLEKDKTNKFDLRLYGNKKMLKSKKSHLNFYYNVINKVVKKKYLISSDIPIKETLNNYGLTLHTYFGTAFYETLAINFPSIIYIDKSNKKYFTDHFLQSIKFAENRIVFYDKKKLKKFIKSKSFRKNWYSDKNQVIVKKLQTKLCRITDKKSYLSSINQISRKL